MQLLVLFDSEHAIANSLHILMPFHCFLLQIELLPVTTKPLLLPKSTSMPLPELYSAANPDFAGGLDWLCWHLGLRFFD